MLTFMNVLRALTRAANDLWHPRMLAVLFLPMLGAIALWVLLSWVFWGTWTGWLAGLLEHTAAGQWLMAHGAAWLTGSLSVLLTVALIIPATLVTSILITEIVAMPVIVRFVEQRLGTPLAHQGEGGVAGSVLNALGGVLVFMALWLVTLPLWFTGIGAIVVPALNSAYLNQRLFRYDALADHATRAEYRRICESHRIPMFLLGLSLSPLYYVPLVNLAAPVVSGLAFTHFCLGVLRQQRAADTPSRIAR